MFGLPASASGRGIAGLRRALDDLEQAPGLALGQRAARADRHGVAFAALVALVVGEQLGAPAHELAVRRVLHQALDHHRDRLVGLVARDAAGQGLRRLVIMVGHQRSPAAAFWFSTVFTRAMFLRTLATWSLLASWPVAFCMRRLNCSRRSSVSSA